MEDKQTTLPTMRKNSGDDTSVLELLQKIEKNTDEQKSLVQKQVRWVRLCATLLILLVVVVCTTGAVLVPRIGSTLVKADSILENLEIVTETLSAEDITGLLKNAAGFMAQSEESMSKTLEEVNHALEALKGVDIDSLNEAIQDLKSVVSPLANIFGR